MAKTRKAPGPKTPALRSRKGARRAAAPRKPQGQATPPSAAEPIAPAAAAPAKPPRPSKKASLIALLQRPDGAAISDLIEATGWQVHSVRAALTGFRKEGKELVRAKDEGGVTHYRLAAEAQA
jgi:hypothetical protein